VRTKTSAYIVYSADASGIAFALLSLLALSHHRYWLAAGCAAAAAACKQTLIGVGIAEAIWLFVAVSPRAAWHQVARSLAAGSAIVLAAILYFGAPGLWHTMIVIPGSFPWAALHERLGEHHSYLTFHVLLPILVIVACRRRILTAKSPFLLPAIAFLFTLPFSLAGFLKIGGNVNSLHSFWLWLPPSLIVFLTGRRVCERGPVASIAIGIVTVVLASHWLNVSRIRVRPNLQAYLEASHLAARLPHKIWFPMHPIVTLYSDGLFYHDLDGLCERSFARKYLSDEHFFSHMPAHRQASATLLPVGWGRADISEARLPQGTPVGIWGLWRVDGSLE
jgi:hypothetical protein